MAFVKVAKVEDVPAGTMKKAIVGEKELLIINLEGKFYAMNDRCWHRNGDLSLGKLEGNVVTCPRHGSQYDIRTGKGLRGPLVALIRMGGKDLPSYEAKVEGSDVLVNL